MSELHNSEKVKHVLRFMKPPPQCLRRWMRLHITGEVPESKDGIERTSKTNASVITAASDRCMAAFTTTTCAAVMFHWSACEDIGGPKAGDVAWVRMSSVRQFE